MKLLDLILFFIFKYSEFLIFLINYLKKIIKILMTLLQSHQHISVFKQENGKRINLCTF